MLSSELPGPVSDEPAAAATVSGSGGSGEGGDESWSSVKAAGCSGCDVVAKSTMVVSFADTFGYRRVRFRLELSRITMKLSF